MLITALKDQRLSWSAPIRGRRSPPLLLLRNVGFVCQCLVETTIHSVRPNRKNHANPSLKENRGNCIQGPKGCAFGRLHRAWNNPHNNSLQPSLPKLCSDI